jgi:hypothetical protein
VHFAHILKGDQMAATTTQKCSVRRAVLNEVQALVFELIQANEAADRTAKQLIAAGLSDAEVKNSVDKILTAGGPSSTTTADTADNLTARVINLLIASDPSSIGWQYLAE